MFHLENSGSTSTATNQLLASLTEIIGRAFIEKTYFQNHSIPMTTLIYLANDLIKTLDKKEQPEKLSLAKELVISYKQVMGKALTPDEEKYDDEIHELDVMGEIMSGVKYATSFSIFKNLYHSVSSTITQGLSEHIPAIVGSTAAITVAPYLLSKAIEKVLAKSKLSTEQKAIVTPWLNTFGRLALAFIPKVEANEQGVQYQYPSTEGHKELFKKININVIQNGKHLLGDKADSELLSEKLGFKLRRIQLVEANSVEVVGVDRNNDEMIVSFSERHSDELALMRSSNGDEFIPSLQSIAKQSPFISTAIDTAYNYLPNQYTLTNAIIAFGTQKILQQNPAPFLPLFMASSLFIKPAQAQTNTTTQVTTTATTIPQPTGQGYGALGNEFLVNTNITNNQDNPKIAQLNDGGFVAVWQSAGQDVGGTRGIYGKRYSASGIELALPTSGINTAVGNEFRVNSVTVHSQCMPAISSLLDGGFVVVWSSFGQDVGGTQGIYGKRFAVNGTELALPTSGSNTAVGNEFRVNSDTAHLHVTPAISSLFDGGFVVVWEGCVQDGVYNGIYGKRFAVNGTELALPTSGSNTAVGNEFRVNSDTGHNHNYPAISSLLDGGFVVVWVSNGQDVGSTYGIYGKRFAMNGTELALPTSGTNTAVGNEFRVNSDTAHSQNNPAISSLPDGGFVVMWQGIGQDVGGTFGIYGKRFAVNGTELALPTSGNNTAVGNEFRVNSYTANNQCTPAISSLSDGGFVVVWESVGQDVGGTNGIYGKRFAMNGTELAIPTSGINTAVGKEFRVNSDTGHNQCLPVISSLPDGGFVAVWESLSQDSSGYGGYGKRFAVNGTEVPLQTNFSTTLAVTTTTASTLPTTKNPTTTTVVPTTTQNSQPTSNPTTTKLQTTTLNPSTTVVSSTPATTNVNQHSSQSLNKSSSNNITIPLIAGIIGGCVVITGIGIGTFFLAKKLKKSKRKNSQVEEIFDNDSRHSTNNRNSNIELSSTNINRIGKNRTVIVGNNGNYALVNKITEEEAKALKQQTGLDVKFLPGEKKAKFLLGEGQFSKLRLAQDIKTKEFIGVKKIKGDDEIRASEQEAIIQSKFKNTPNIMPLLDSCRSQSSEGNDALYQFMPLASFGNGEYFRDLLNETKSNIEQRETVLLYVLKQLLSGLQAMHKQQVYHLDLKPANIVFKPSGELFIIDFGCAVESKNGMIGLSNGDSRYFSPERYAAYRQEPREKFDGKQSDTWALGVTLLEMAIGRYPFGVGMGFKVRIEKWDESYFQKTLSQLPEWKTLQTTELGKIIKGLLETDIKNRLSINAALKLPAMKKDIFASDEEREKLFAELKSNKKRDESKNKIYDQLPKIEDENYPPHIYQKAPDLSILMGNNNDEPDYQTSPNENTGEYNTKTRSSVTVAPKSSYFDKGNKFDNQTLIESPYPVEKDLEIASNNFTK